MRVGDDVDCDFDVHGGFERVAVHFAVALQRVSVAEVQERAGVADREIDGCTFADLVEVHVAAIRAGIACGWRRIGGIRRGRDAAEHRLYRDGKVLHVVAGLFRRRGSVSQVELPADLFAVVAGRDGDVAVEAAIDDVVVALRPVAVKFEPYDVHYGRGAGVGSNNVIGPGFRVAADDTANAMFVLSAGIDGGGVDRVAGRDFEDGLVERGELTIEGRRC